MSTPRRSDREVDAARRNVPIVLTPTDPYTDSELTAFDVDVEGMGLIGRWAQTGERRGVVTWTDGTHAQTECPPTREAVTAAIRPSIPIRVEYDERLEARASGPRTLPGLTERP